MIIHNDIKLEEKKSKKGLCKGCYFYENRKDDMVYLCEEMEVIPCRIGTILVKKEVE